MVNWPSSVDGVLRLSVDLSIDMAEFSNWPPNCIAAFMAGIAQCLEAKAHANAATMRPERALAIAVDTSRSSPQDVAVTAVSTIVPSSDERTNG